MNRIRRLIANPYKPKVLLARLLRRPSRWLLRRRLAKTSPEALSSELRIETDPAEHFRARSRPRFFFDRERIGFLVSATPGDQADRLSREAERFLGGVFVFRGLEPAAFADKIDWLHTVAGDPDWNADLNRLDWIITLLLAAFYSGEARYGERASAVLIDWWERNPPGSPPWRDSFEVAQRCNTLAWILHLGSPLSEFTDTALLSALGALAAGSRWTAATLEYHNPGNHLLVQAVRLTQMGVLFPEFQASRGWLKRGLGLLEREVARQVLPDGVHAERSVFYQRIVLEALVEMLALAKMNGMELHAGVTESCRKMAAFLEGICRPDGEYPLLGDGFRSDVLLRYSLRAAANVLLDRDLDFAGHNLRTSWLLNGTAPQRPAKPIEQPTPIWPDGGYAVLRRGEGPSASYLAFDFGSFGIKAAPGHGQSTGSRFWSTPAPTLGTGVRNGAQLFAERGPTIPPSWTGRIRRTSSGSTRLGASPERPLAVSPSAGGSER